MHVSYALMMIMASFVIASALPAAVTGTSTLLSFVSYKAANIYGMADEKIDLTPLGEWYEPKEADE